MLVELFLSQFPSAVFVYCLLQQLPDFTDVELCRGDFVSELTRMQELTEENTKLRSQLLELQQPSEVDSNSLVDSGQQSRSMVSK